MASAQKSNTLLSGTKSLEKEQKLRQLIRGMGSVLIAYSGGVDSTYLALVATQELGSRAVCVLGVSASVSKNQVETAREYAAKFRFKLASINTEEFKNPDYVANPANRCFFCKDELYGKLSNVAAENGIKWVLDGANLDDLSDHRPGREAAKLYNIRSVLLEVGLTKMEIRELSKKQKLPTWDQPASPCLSSRIAYGVPVTIERLSRVERGEIVLRKLGLKEFRVRNHDDLARIEIAKSELHNILDANIFKLIADKFRELGFRYVTLDLHGFRSGALNEVFKDSN